MSAIDELHARILPGHFLKSVQAREAVRSFRSMTGNTGGGHEGAADSWFRQLFSLFRSKPVDEDRHTGQANRNTLVLECRDLMRNYGIAYGFGRRFGRNVIASGINLEMRSDDDAANREAEDFIRQWKSSYDVRGRISFDERCRLAITARLFEGDGLDVRLANGQCQPIESERICSRDPMPPNAREVAGVVMDSSGRINGFQVCPRDRDGRVDPTKPQFVPANEATFFAAPYRIDQVRGLPEISSVLNELKDLRQGKIYQLNKFKLDQLNGFSVNREGGGVPGNLVSRHEANGGTGNQPIAQTVADGIKFWWLGKGESIQSLASNTPNPQFEMFALLTLRFIAASLNVPLEFLIMDYRNLSWSTSRAVVEQAKSTILDWHDWIITEYARPTILWRLAMAIADREIRPFPIEPRRIGGLPVSQLFRARFSIPDYAHIQRELEADADEKEWRIGKTSLDEIARKKGLSGREAMLKAKDLDIREAIKLAQAVTAETGVPVAWTDYINAIKAGAPTVAPATVPTTGETPP